MNLRVHLLPDLVEPADLAGRTVVVIDVLRATTTIAHALAAGATCVVPCLEIDEARAKARELGGESRNGVVLGGERRGVRIEGFDLGNSPTEYTANTVGGKIVVFTTTNGTRAMHRAAQASEVLLGSFATLSAVVDVLREREHIDLVCAGTFGAITAEDAFLAGALINSLPIPHSPFAIELNDQARLVGDAWRANVASGRSLAAALRECQGGRNLIAEGFDADIDTAARIDALAIVPRLDPHTGRITTK